MAEPDAVLTRAHAPRRRRLLLVVRVLLIAATLSYIGFIVWHDLPEVVATLLPFTPERGLWLLVSTALLGSCTLTSCLTFHVLALGRSSEPLSFARTLNLFLVANLMRHLPGRFLGIAYQATAPLAGLTPTAMVRLNLEQLVLSVIGNTIIGFGVLLFESGRPVWGALVVASAAPLMVLVLGFQPPARLRLWLEAHAPKRLRRALVASRATASRPRWLWIAALVNLVSWVPYLLAWASLGRLFPALEGEPLVLLGGVYTVAWAAGMLSFVTPGGVGVREVVFVLVGASHAARESLAFIAIFARLWQLGADLLSWLLGVALPALGRRALPGAAS